MVQTKVRISAWDSDPAAIHHGSYPSCIMIHYPGTYYSQSGEVGWYAPYVVIMMLA